MRKQTKKKYLGNRGENTPVYTGGANHTYMEVETTESGTLKLEELGKLLGETLRVNGYTSPEDEYNSESNNSFIDRLSPDAREVLLNRVNSPTVSRVSSKISSRKSSKKNSPVLKLNKSVRSRVASINTRSKASKRSQRSIRVEDNRNSPSLDRSSIVNIGINMLKDAHKEDKPNPVPKKRKPKAQPRPKPRSLSKDYTSMSGLVNQQSVLASTLVQRTKESREDSHVLYRIFGDGLCSIYCLFTILGYSKLILTNTSTELRRGMFNTYNLITPVYLIDFFEDLSKIKTQSCIDKITKIAQFLGLKSDIYKLKYKEFFTKGLQKIIESKKESNPILEKYLLNLLFFINFSKEERNQTAEEAADFYSIMEGDDYLDEIIHEYFKIVLKKDIGSTIHLGTGTIFEEFNKIVTLNGFNKLSSDCQDLLQVNPIELTKKPEGLTDAEGKKIIQNTIYFLYMGVPQRGSRDVGNVSSHWNLVVPKSIHEYIENKKKELLEKSSLERWKQAFVRESYYIDADLEPDSPYKSIHLMWTCYVFPHSQQERNDNLKVKVSKKIYEELFNIDSLHIGFLSTWIDTLKKIEAKLKVNSDWLGNPLDKTRAKICHSEFDIFFKENFKKKDRNGNTMYLSKYMNKTKYYLHSISNLLK